MLKFRKYLILNIKKLGGKHKMNENKLENNIVPLVGIVMGSESDLKVMKVAAQIMEELKIPYEIKVVSAHRTPDRMYEYSNSAEKRELEVIIAGAGGAAHLPGMISSMTLLPVVGVPVKLRELDGMDSLLSIVQMPGGVPVATVGINNAKNAGILAARILSIKHPEIRDRLNNYMTKIKENVVFDLEDKLAESWSIDNEKTN
jgi:5-(carboxyamino)imidazole ribonucleotide mutase